ncbi:MAG: hypothetical protein ACYDD4_03495 [Acidimicrobiales bacterium]
MSGDGRTATGASFLPLSRRRVRQVVGVSWLVAAGLALRPAAFTTAWWHLQVGKSAMGQPAPIGHSIIWAVRVVGSTPVLSNSLFVAAQATIGLALVIGCRQRLAIVASVPLALGIWWVGEGLGALPTGFASFPGGAPGAVLLYPLLSFLAWPASQADGTRPVHSRCGRLAWAVLWCGQAMLIAPWRFPAGQVLGATVEENSAGPSWITGAVSTVGSFCATHGPPIALGLAAATTFVGITVTSLTARRVGLVAGLALLGVFWLVFQGGAGVFTGDASDVGTAPLMATLALALWPRLNLIHQSRWVRGQAGIRRRQIAPL